MTTIIANVPPIIPGVHDGPVGERYYRHPGDIVRVIVWGAATVALVVVVAFATGTSEGVRSDLGRVSTAPPRALRELLLAIVQVGAVLAPVAVAVALAVVRRWRRIATLTAAAAAGAVLAFVVRSLYDESAPVAGVLSDESWLISTRFPSLTYLAAATAVVAVCKPWLARDWRRVGDIAVGALTVAMAMAGTAGVPELALAVTSGGLAGSLVLVAFGAPNRRPTSALVAAALEPFDLGLRRLALERAVGGRAQLYRAESTLGPLFLKVYGKDSRDADTLYRAYRSLILRDPGESWPIESLDRCVEHETLLLVLADRGGVACPAVHAIAATSEGSMVLVMDDVGGRRLDELGAAELEPRLLDDVWRHVTRLHAAGLAHGALRAANILVTDDGRPVLIDLGAGSTTNSPRVQAIDRAELLASLADLVGRDMAVASASRIVVDDDLAAAMPYLQPLALSAATRRAVPKAALAELRRDVAATTEREPVPLERLVRVRPRTIVTIATLTGAFYVLLPQLANVDDSISALRTANWGWLAGAVAMSACTYLGAALGLLGAVRQRLPFVTTAEASLASSFVNRVTPANIGGMALNVRYMQKAGVPPAEAVTAVGLNVAAGGIVHIGLLAVFFAWARQGDGASFSLPASSKMLIAIAVVLALAGAAMATRRGRKLARRHVIPSLRRSAASIASLAQSPIRVAALFGGSAGVTLAYIGALACAVNAFDGGLSFAEVGAVYLGASLIAAAAPTPGGLGAIEAALVAGLTAIGVDPAIVVATVLSYRLLTYWLPILPGWLCLRLLDRRGYI